MKTKSKTWTLNNGEGYSPSKSQQTLCESYSPGFTVQGTPDCKNTSNSDSQCQQAVSGQPNHGKLCAKVTLKGGRVALIDASDWELVQGHNWRAFLNHNTYYAVSGTGLLMHRLILGIHTLGREVEVDHIDGDGLNNTRANIRATTRSVNLQNRAAYGKSGCKGVKRSANGKRWCARIYQNGKPILLGTHDTKEQACAAYDKMAKARYGQQARVNLPADTLPCPTQKTA